MGRAAKAKRARRDQEARRATEVHTVVLTGIQDSALSLTDEVRYCKAALLYADRVTLFSPKTFMLASVAQLAVADRATIIDLLVGLGDTVFRDKRDDLARFKALFDSLPSRSQLTSRQRYEKRQLLDSFDGPMAALREVAASQWIEAGGPELEPAMAHGVLTLDPLVNDGDAGDGLTDVVIDRVLARLTSTLSDPTVYPLLDEQMTTMARHAIEEGAITPGDASLRRGKDTGLARGLVLRLPTFPAAKMDEILHIRAELAAPLVRFRNGVRGLSSAVSVTATDPDFEPQVAEAWTTTVAPALAEIEERVQADKPLRSLAGAMLRDPQGIVAGPLAAGGLGFAIEPSAGWLGAIGAAVTGGVSGARAVNERRQHLQATERLPYYFLHEAARRMGR